MVKTALALLLSKGKTRTAASLAGLKSGGPADFMGWFNLPEHKCLLWPPQQIRVKTGTSKLLPNVNTETTSVC